MTFHTSDLFFGKKAFPAFITEHPIFEQYATIEKIFPHIGLENCSVKAAPHANEAFLQEMVYGKVMRLLPTHYGFAPTWVRQVIDCFDDDSLPFFSTKRGKVCFDVPNKHLGRKTLKQVVPVGPYSKRLDSIPTDIKDELSELKIVFSSDGVKGMWDTATMSMRGLTSCQSWSGTYRRNLIGTMVDPFAGIIYLTNGHNHALGEKMLARSVVRYVQHTQTKKPHLLVERVYSNGIYETEEEIFGEFLAKKTGLPLYYHSGDGKRLAKYTIPGSKIVRELEQCSSYPDAKYHCLSYRDSRISYSKSLLPPY